MSKVYVMLADGFEEIEGLTVVDLLRRAKIDIDMVSISNDLIITGSHGIKIKADKVFESTDFDIGDMIVLPGGGVGTENLAAFKPLIEILNQYSEQGKMLAAICAAPSVFGDNGLLHGKKATCYPGFEDRLEGADISKEAVVKDGNFITSRGLGTAIDFSLEIIKHFVGNEVSEHVATSIIYR